jgi:hypothetical protein
LLMLLLRACALVNTVPPLSAVVAMTILIVVGRWGCTRPGS